MTSLTIINDEEIVNINDNDKQIASQNIAVGIHNYENIIQEDESLTEDEKTTIFGYTSSIILLSGDIDNFFESLYPGISDENGRTQKFLKKLKHAFQSVVGAVITVAATAVGVIVGLAGGPVGAVVGGAVGFSIGVEMGFYFSCEYIPALNSPQNCLECAEGGFKNLTCQDCQAVYPSISC